MEPVSSALTDARYEERFHALTVVGPITRIIGFFASIITLSLVMTYWLEAYQIQGMVAAARFKSALPAVISIALVVSAYACYCTYWRWKHTTMYMDHQFTGVRREGSVLWASKQFNKAVKTTSIDAITLNQSVPARIFAHLFGWNIWHVDMDTPASQDKFLNDLRFVKDAPRLTKLQRGYSP